MLDVGPARRSWSPEVINGVRDAIVVYTVNSGRLDCLWLSLEITGSKRFRGLPGVSSNVLSAR